MAMIPKISCCFCDCTKCICKPKNIINKVKEKVDSFINSKPIFENETNFFSDKKDPFENFRIKRYYESNNYLLLHVFYPAQQTLYESNKYLVFKDVCFNDVYMWNKIDPHFCNNPEHPSPIARFQPTQEGWCDAIDYINTRTK